jgi:hypothetical protein
MPTDSRGSNNCGRTRGRGRSGRKGKAAMQPRNATCGDSRGQCCRPPGVVARDATSLSPPFLCAGRSALHVRSLLGRFPASLSAPPAGPAWYLFSTLVAVHRLGTEDPRTRPDVLVLHARGQNGVICLISSTTGALAFASAAFLSSAAGLVSCRLLAFSC